MEVNRASRRRLLRAGPAPKTQESEHERADREAVIRAAEEKHRSTYDPTAPIQLDPDAIAERVEQSDVFRRSAQGTVQSSTVDLSSLGEGVTIANGNGPIVIGGRGQWVPANTAMRAFVWHGTNSRPRGETITSFATNVEDAMRTVALRELGIEPDEADMYTAEITAWIAANLRGRMNMQHSLDRGYVIYSGATTAPGRPAAGDDDDY